MNNEKRVRLACYATNLSMAIVANLSPILFLTFRDLYGISYSLLGLLVLINFCTQLLVDLLFSFFSHRINIKTAIRATPVLTIAGLLIYAVLPMLFPSGAYFGIVLGTVIFSASGGFSEVLISPTIVALSDEDSDRDVSKLHSIYAWGVVFAVVFGTVFLLIFKNENWQWLAITLSLVPLASAILFAGARLPDMETPKKTSGAVAFLRQKRLWLCVTAIFLGGAAECTMAQWSSGYIERALGLPKIIGDVFGVALFGAMLGLGRSLYAKYGKNVERVLLFGAVGATLCYLTAAISGIAVIGLLACALTGLCVSMLWPGSLIVAEKHFPESGVFIFAIMAAGGDLGASVGPQLVGIVTDAVASSSVFQDIAATYGMTMEEIGMKCGMLAGMLFPLLGTFIYFVVMKMQNKEKCKHKLTY